MKIKKILNIFLIMFVILAFSGCGAKKKAPENQYKRITLTAAQEKNAQIKTALINVMDMDMQITIPAQFKARNQAIDHIYSPIEGKIVNIFVEPGTIVQAGQALATMKSDDISQIQLEFLERVMDIDSDIRQMQAQYQVSSQEYNREHILFREKIASRSEYEIARASMEKDRAGLSSLRIKKNALIRVYQQRLSIYGGGSINTVLATKRVYPYITLTANKNGIVLERKVNPGELAEQDKEMFNLADLSTIWLVGYAFEKDAPLLHVGEKVKGSLEEETNKDVNGILSYVSPILDTSTKTLEVRADIDNPNGYIKPNMYAEMKVNTGKAKRLAVPNSALQKYGDYYFAYVKVKPFVYEERKVKLGQKNEKFAEIVSGLKEGEEVVTNGAFSLLGESIKLQEAGGDN